MITHLADLKLSKLQSRRKGRKKRLLRRFTTVGGMHDWRVQSISLIFHGTAIRENAGMGNRTVKIVQRTDG